MIPALLAAEVVPGLFPDEYAIRIKTQDGPVKLFVDRRDVVGTRVKVEIFDEYEFYSYVALPANPYAGNWTGRCVLVPKGDLRKEDVKSD